MTQQKPLLDLLQQGLPLPGKENPRLKSFSTGDE